VLRVAEERLVWKYIFWPAMRRAFAGLPDRLDMLAEAGRTFAVVHASTAQDTQAGRQIHLSGREICPDKRSHQRHSVGRRR